MNQKILRISAILMICFLFAGFVTASNTTQSKKTGLDVSPNVKPNITAINPNSGKLGKTVNFTLTGTGFSNKAKVYLDNGAIKNPKSIIANDVKSNLSSTITGSFNIPDSSTPGVWNVTIKEAGLVSPSKVTFTITK